MIDLIYDPTFQTVCLGTALVGACSGALGCYAYLRKQSLVGDVIAHSSLFGVMVFFLLHFAITGEGTRSLFVLIPGAVFAGVIALWLNHWLIRTTSVRPDSNLGVMLAIFFGSGIFLLRWTQRMTPPVSEHRGLEGYLFGQAAALTYYDLVMIGVLGAVSSLAVGLFWKELKAFSFDATFSQSVGVRSQWMEFLLIVLLVIGIVIGIQSIGVVLMIALLITPAAAARQWVRSLGGMVALAALFGATSGVVGSILSATIAKMPAGPAIILVCISVFVVSLLLAPGRGILSRIVTQRMGQLGRQSWKGETS